MLRSRQNLDDTGRSLLTHRNHANIKESFKVFRGESMVSLVSRSIQIISAATLAMLTAHSAAEAAIIDLGTFDGHEYFYDTGSFLSLSDARQAAQSGGFQLTSITSAVENDFLIKAITPIAETSLRTAWIGLSRPTVTDQFGWDSGEAFLYSNWRPAGVGPSFPEPTGETAGVFYVNNQNVNIPIGFWADTFSVGTEPFNAIYESVPVLQSVPGPLPILGIGTAFMWSRKLRNRIRSTAFKAAKKSIR